VILNLVTNARDAIQEKKKARLDSGDDVITIRSFKENDRVAVSVSDTGAGIPEAEKNRIFEPFYTTKEVGKGMGLGLSITYGIVKDYGGEIEVYSDEGTGTTFKLTFPFAQ
jgi:histidine kinase